MRTTTRLGLVLTTLILLPWLMPAPGCGQGDPGTPPEDGTPAAPPDAGEATPAVAPAPSAAAPATLSTALTAAVEAIPAEDRARTVPEGTDAAAGKAPFGAQCASCHGAGGKGDGAAASFLDPAPGDLTSAARAGATTPGEKAWLIANGVGGGSAMPGFAASLSEEQIWQIVAYLETLSK